jgi:UDP-glucuronate 4-epimerase
MRFLVTGTAGFIGFHLAKRLLDDGHTVVGFDGMTRYYDPALKEARNRILESYPDFTFVAGMLEDAATLRRATELARPDIIIHLAAQAGVRYSLENPGAYIQSNVVGSTNLLELAKEIKPRHLLLASTSSVYGANPDVPFRESDRTDAPLSIYAGTKKAMEAIAHSYSHLFHIPTTAFRFFTVYGPWGRPDMALFKFVNAILNDRPIEVYGEGRMSRDFTYVDDLVEAIVRLVDVPPAQAVPTDGNAFDPAALAPFRIVNIGGGTPVGLMEFIEAIEAALGRKAVRKMLPMQPGDVPRTFADPSVLKSLTGYVPSTPVKTGVEAFVDWYCDYHKMNMPRAVA